MILAKSCEKGEGSSSDLAHVVRIGLDPVSKSENPHIYICPAFIGLQTKQHEKQPKSI